MNINCGFKTVACQTVASRALVWETQTEFSMADKSIDSLRRDLAHNIRAIRVGRGYAQERLGLEAGVDRTVVSKIERGVTNPSLETLLKLANVLDVSVAEFFRDPSLGA
jgi:DNA-binding XRE family transcriptional regulator